MAGKVEREIMSKGDKMMAEERRKLEERQAERVRRESRRARDDKPEGALGKYINKGM